MTTLNRFARSANVAIHSPSAAAPRGSGGPSRADRAAKSASTKPGANAVASSAGEVRRTGPGNPTTTASRSAPGSRWAHFAGMTLQNVAAPERVVHAPTDAAAFVAASAAKARGQKAPIQSEPPAPPEADISTPEGAAAFIAASAAKVRGPSR